MGPEDGEGEAGVVEDHEEQAEEENEKQEEVEEEEEDGEGEVAEGAGEVEEDAVDTRACVCEIGQVVPKVKRGCRGRPYFEGEAVVPLVRALQPSEPLIFYNGMIKMWFQRRAVAVASGAGARTGSKIGPGRYCSTHHRIRGLHSLQPGSGSVRTQPRRESC